MFVSSEKKMKQCRNTNALFAFLKMNNTLVYLTTPEDYISRLEDYANQNLFDPSCFSFDSNLEYLNQLLEIAKDCAAKDKIEDAYIGFRRYQIVLTILQKHNLYDPNDARIRTLNIVRMVVLTNEEKCAQISTIVDILRKK